MHTYNDSLLEKSSNLFIIHKQMRICIAYVRFWHVQSTCYYNLRLSCSFHAINFLFISERWKHCPWVKCERNCRKVIGDDGCYKCECEQLCTPPKCDPGCEIQKVFDGPCPGCECKGIDVDSIIYIN